MSHAFLALTLALAPLVHRVGEPPRKCGAAAGDGSVYAVCEDERVAVFDGPTGALRGTHAATAPTELSFSPDGRALAVFSGGALALWDLRTGHWSEAPAVAESDGRRGPLRVRHAWSGDGHRLAVVAEAPTDEWASVHIFRAPHLERVAEDRLQRKPLPWGRTLPAGQAPADSRWGSFVTWGGPVLWVGGPDSQAVARWDRSGRRLAPAGVSVTHPTAIAASPDGRWVGVGGQDASLSLVDTRSGVETTRSPTAPVRAGKAPGQGPFVAALAFDAAGGRVAAEYVLGSTGELMLWQVGASSVVGAELGRTSAREGSPLRFDGDGRRVLASCQGPRAFLGAPFFCWYDGQVGTRLAPAGLLPAATRAAPNEAPVGVVLPSPEGVWILGPGGPLAGDGQPASGGHPRDGEANGRWQVKDGSFSWVRASVPDEGGSPGDRTFAFDARSWAFSGDPIDPREAVPDPTRIALEGCVSDDDYRTFSCGGGPPHRLSQIGSPDLLPAYLWAVEPAPDGRWLAAAIRQFTGDGEQWVAAIFARDGADPVARVPVEGTGIRIEWLGSDRLIVQCRDGSATTRLITVPEGAVIATLPGGDWLAAGDRLLGCAPGQPPRCSAVSARDGGPVGEVPGEPVSAPSPSDGRVLIRLTGGQYRLLDPATLQPGPALAARTARPGAPDPSLPPVPAVLERHSWQWSADGRWLTWTGSGTAVLHGRTQGLVYESAARRAVASLPSGLLGVAEGERLALVGEQGTIGHLYGVWVGTGPRALAVLSDGRAAGDPAAFSALREVRGPGLRGHLGPWRREASPGWVLLPVVEVPQEHRP